MRINHISQISRAGTVSNMKRYLGIIPLFFVFLAILTLWIWPDMGFWALIAVSPLLIIMVICALVAIIRTLARGEFKNEFSGKLKLALAAVNLVLIISFPLIRVPMYRCDEHKMETKYEAIRNDLGNLSSYLSNHLKDGRNILLEFNGRDVEMFFVADSSDHYHRVGYYDDNLNAQRIDSLCRLAGLDSQAFEHIRKTLKDIGCISIETHFPDYCDFGYKRAGFGMYSFRLLTDNDPKGTMQKFIEDVECIPYDDKCLFLFQGGAVGPLGWNNETKVAYMESRHWKGI